MKKLRVYYKSSLLNDVEYFNVANPEEGKLLIDSLNYIVGRIISVNGLAPAGTFAIGLEEFYAEDGQWYDWLHPELGCNIDELEELEA